MTFTGYWHLSAHSFKQLEHYTFYGPVVTIPKEVPILGAETRVQIVMGTIMLDYKMGFMFNHDLIEENL